MFFFVFAVSGEFITVLLRVKFKRGAAKSLAEDTSELAEEDQTDQHEPTAAWPTELLHLLFCSNSRGTETFSKSK